MDNLKLTILGSGGAIPTPRPFCQCEVCRKARKIGEPYKRNNSSLLINKINTIIDCGGDIADSLNRRDVKQVENIFITHWHPDHTFGLKRILDANYDFISEAAERVTDIYIPKKVYETLKQKFPVIDHSIDIQKTGRLHLIEDGERIKIGDFHIGVVGYGGKYSDIYAYLIETGGKRVIYAPCDTLNFANYKNFKGLDLFISEVGVFVDCAGEILFENVMDRLKEMAPKRTILTHIEEDDVRAKGVDYLHKMKEKYSAINFDFAYDGMKIAV